MAADAVLRAANRSRPGRVALTLASAACGGWVFQAVGLPAGWIAGSILVVALASLAGLQTEVPARLRGAVFLLLGIFVGSGVRPELVDQIVTWPVSFAILAVAIGLIIYTTYLWLRWVGWDRQTALLSGLPGALSFVIAAAEAVGADMRKVAVNQSVRLLVLIEVLPLVVFILGGTVASERVELPAATASGAFDWPSLGLLIAAGAAGGFVVARTGLPGGLMLGGLLTSAALYLTGAVDLVVPQWLVTPGIVALGAIAGSRFRPGDAAVLRQIAGTVLIAFAIGMSISTVAAVLVSALLGVPLEQTLIAFAPGALDALTVLAFTLDLDPAYVAAHHVVRFVVLAVTIPFVARRIAGRAKARGG